MGKNEKTNEHNNLKSPNDGYLGSCIDDERSKSRKVVWHATYRESSTLRTQSACTSTKFIYLLFFSEIRNALVHSNICSNDYFKKDERNSIIVWTKGKCTRARLSTAKKKKKIFFIHFLYEKRFEI
jgi:hypothetical protein